jgi:hypothetical protein
VASKKPVTVIRAQAVRAMKDALEKHGYKVMRETWDGGSQTESFEVRSRGVDTLIIVADPAYLSEPDPDPKRSPIPLNPMRGPHKERAVGLRQRSRRPTGSSLAACDEAAAFPRRNHGQKKRAQ